MKVRKWNYKTHEYDDFEAPDFARASVSNLSMKIQCPHCGEWVVAGDCYTSLEIHTPIGFGFLVCEKCYEKEWEERRKHEKGV